MLRKYIFLLLGCFILTSCSSTPPSLEGYWMNEYGGTITFDGTGQGLWYGKVTTYSEYDNDKVLIYENGEILGNFKYSISSNTLTLYDLDSNVSSEYYGSEKKQSEILENLESEAAQRQAEESISIADYEAPFIQRDHDAELEMWEKNIAALSYTLTDPEFASDKEYYSAWLNHAKNRASILKNKDETAIQLDSIRITQEYLLGSVLPPDIAQSEKTILLPEGTHCITLDDGTSNVVACIIRVVLDSGYDTTTTYGVYSMCMSNYEIYQWDISTDTWFVVAQINI